MTQGVPSPPTAPGRLFPHLCELGQKDTGLLGSRHGGNLGTLSFSANAKAFWEWVKRHDWPKELGPIVPPDRNVSPMGARVTHFGANMVGASGVGDLIVVRFNELFKNQ